MAPVTFRRGKKKKKGEQIKFFRCDVEEGTGVGEEGEVRGGSHPLISLHTGELNYC